MVCQVIGTKESPDLVGRGLAVRGLALVAVVGRTNVVHGAGIGVGPVTRLAVRIAILVLAYRQLVRVCCCFNGRRKANPEGAYGKGGYG